MHYRNILLEGTDRGGKSTLAQRLSEDLGLDVIKLRHQPGAQFERYLGYYQHANRAVFDRGHISEELYGPIYGRPPSFSAEERRKLDHLVNKTCLVIFCLPNLEDAKQRLKKQIKAGEEVITLKDLTHSRQAFEKVLTRFPQHLIHCSGPWEEQDKLIQRVKKLFGPRLPLYPT